MNNKLNIVFSKLKINNIICMLFLIILIFLVLIGFIPLSLAGIQPVDNVEIYSEILDYEKSVPGAWLITKSAKWTGAGEAEITIDVQSILKTKDNLIDVILVLDISSSMNGERLDRVKTDSIDLVENLLSNDKNRMGLITFGTSSEIILDLTSDKEALIEEINRLEDNGGTNYYQALVNVNTLLENYSKMSDRECVVLFLTDGFPNVDTPNEVGQYNYLRSNYPYLNINAIQYEMGNTISESVIRVSDNQFVADVDTLHNVLFDASNMSSVYDDFVVTDYIDSDYFYIKNNNSIKVSQGEAIFNENEQMVKWKLTNYVSGAKASLKIKVNLKNDLADLVYSTNKELKINSTIGKVTENIVSKQTPFLNDNYKVVYDGNAPNDCAVTGVPSEKRHSVYEKVEISDKNPKCHGYQFKGWKITSPNVLEINDDYFIMPESNVNIKAIWSKININKSMNGTVEPGLTLYKQVEEDANNPEKFVAKYEGDTSTFKGKENIYYYYGAAANNNVIFANYCWKIIRTTDTGGVKLLYNGVPSSDGKCNNTSTASVVLTAEQMNRSSNNISFNTISTSPADVGYMFNTRFVEYSKTTSSIAKALYGNSFIYNNGTYTLQNTRSATMETDSTKLNNYHYTCFNTTGTCSTVSFIINISKITGTSKTYYINLQGGKSIEDALNEMVYNSDVNSNNSTIKTAIDNWYENNLDSYSEYLEDTVWCNNRTINSLNGFSPSNAFYDGLYSDLTFFSYNSDNDNNIICQNELDRFTVSTLNGNGALTYPVGLITAQEWKMSVVSKESPLMTGSTYWTMSPSKFTSAYSGGSQIVVAGSINVLASNAKNMDYVRPAVSLKTGVYSSEGNGSVNDPYVVFTK